MALNNSNTRDRTWTEYYNQEGKTSVPYAGTNEQKRTEALRSYDPRFDG
jgi:hypothetical protein